MNKKIKEQISLISFFLALSLFFLGSMICFVPGRDEVWFLSVAIIIVPAYFSKNKWLKFFTVLILILSLKLSFDAFQRGKNYQRFMATQKTEYLCKEKIKLERVPFRRPSEDKFCFDYAGVLLDDTSQEIENQSSSIKRSFDIDFVVIIVPTLGENDIVETAVRLFSQWEIGKSTQGKKGILILIAQKEQKIKIEIGYDLEGIYTDTYVGQVEREILKEFLEQSEWDIGFLATIENFLFRIFNNDLMEEVINISSPEDDLKYYSQGAGATNVFDFGAALKRPLPDNYDELKKYFSAQPTPKLAFDRYMELCSQAVKHNNDLTLFTDLSNDFWKGWRHTSGQSKAEAREIAGLPYYIKQKNNYAIVFFPATDPKDLKKACMYFFSRCEVGWQVDINTMTRSLRCVGPGWWMVQDLFQPYSEIIMEEYNLYWGFLTPWDDKHGVAPYGLDYDVYDKNGSIYPIKVWQDYQKISSLKTGDRLISINGEKIRDKKHFWNLHDSVLAGKEYAFKLIRNGRAMIVKEKITEYPDGFKKFRPCLKTPRLWMGVYMVQSLDSEWEYTRKLRNRGMFKYTSLCYVLEVYPGSPADKAGLKVGDLILHYGMNDDNGEIMPYDVIKCLYKTKPGESIEFTILRDMKDKMKIKVTPEETCHRGYF